MIKQYYSFYDMCSGGFEKTEYKEIWIMAFTEEEAIGIFRERFNRDPYNVTCSCCGSDFAVMSEGTETPELTPGLLVIE